MSSLITPPHPQFINPLFGCPVGNGFIYIGYKDTDAMVPNNQQPVYLLGEDNSKTPIPQPLRTNGVGVLIYQGLPATVWVDDAYSIAILNENGVLMYQSLYVDDPTYWLRQDLATLPTPEDPDKGVGMVAGAAPIDSPFFTGDPQAPTPAAGDNDNSLATTAFVQSAVSAATSVGPVGTFAWWLGSTVPAGAVLADGSQLSKDTYPALYAIIGDHYATANGLVPDSASFFVPDFRSRYARGIDNGAGRSGNAELLKVYADMFKAHSHKILSRGPDDVRTGGEPLDDMIPVQSSQDAGLYTQDSGGSETMPMTIPLLPIIWAVPGVTTSNGVQVATLSAWWKMPQYQASRPAVHHYHEHTGELVGSSLAQPSPLEPGVWLTPQQATLTIPPTEQPNTVRVFRDNTWQHDGEIFRQRQQKIAEAKQQREADNRALMERAQRRQQMDAWLKQQGAPFTVEELL